MKPKPIFIMDLLDEIIDNVLIKESTPEKNLIIGILLSLARVRGEINDEELIKYIKEKR